MSTIDNMPRVKKALDNLREVLETERRDRIEFLRSCIGSWKKEIARAEKLPEQIARSEAEIAELEWMKVPDYASLVPVVGDSHGPTRYRVCPGCRNYVPSRQLEPKPDEYADEVDGKKVLVVLCDACRKERSRDV